MLRFYFAFTLIDRTIGRRVAPPFHIKDTAEGKNYISGKGMPGDPGRIMFYL
jgi:hypothetical protein